MDSGHSLASANSGLPPKLVKKILDLEYIDMSELVPDSWRFQDRELESSKCCMSKRPKRGPVSDILLWSECYATLVSVLGERYPTKIVGFMSYFKTILRASRCFQGDAWVSYDMTFRRRAANLKSLDWGAMDVLLFNETFAGRAKQLIRCKFCVSEHHGSADCPYAPEKEDHKSPSFRAPRGNTSRPVVQLCMLFNSKGGSQCRYKQCRFAHLCSRCHGAHSAAECISNQDKTPWQPKEKFAVKRS